MKTLFGGLLATLLLFRASAQVNMELSLEQEHFLPSETIKVAVKVTNRSGQKLHLGVEPDWLTFSVESIDGFVVIKDSEVPVVGPFDLESSQMAIKRVDLQPHFLITKPGRYRINATLRIKEWSRQLTSDPKYFDVISGVVLWSQDFGVPDNAGGPPEVRKYTLEQANYLRDKLGLYVQVTDATLTRVYKVTSLGGMVSFGRPEAQVDRDSNLNVLWQTGAQIFSFCVVKPDGTLAKQEVYDISDGARPRLTADGQGGVLVRGGVRRKGTSEYPAVLAPNELPPLAPADAPAK